jgi:phosphoribosylformimino-5-aminoimidazole carboxamide ribotide isomerase
MLRGPAFELYADLQGAFEGVDITVSGGISAIEDIERLNEMRLRSVIVGKALYEGRITLEQLTKFI